jgi:hypothetical protein
MPVAYRRSRRAVGFAVLAALVLAVLAASAHRHALHLAGTPCTICVVAHHSPVVPDSSAALVSPVWRRGSGFVSVTAATPATRVERASGRAPPHPTAVLA